MRQYVVHPYLDNSHRQAVTEWCEQTLSQDTWTLNSNYKRSPTGTFDLYFNDRESVTVFLLRWGGAIADVIDRTESGHRVNYHALFQEETI